VIASGWGVFTALLFLPAGAPPYIAWQAVETQQRGVGISTQAQVGPGNLAVCIFVCVVKFLGFSQ